jgi:hypothetical protein
MSENGFLFPYHELKDISVLSPPDEKFKIITWNLILSDKTHAFFGFLLVKKLHSKNNKSKEFDFYFMKDISSTIKNPENYTGTPDKWFGMVYYQLIPWEDYYILLGWDGNDGITQKKFIDVLWFKNNDEPVFGKDIFRIPRKNPRRIQFEYSADVVMSLRYWPDKKMIIFSHNSAYKENTDMTNLYQYYGPDGSFDGFYFSKNKWKLIEDLDVRLDKSKNEKKPKPDIKKQKKLYDPNK